MDVSIALVGSCGDLTWGNLHRKGERWDVPRDDSGHWANRLAQGHIDIARCIQARCALGIISPFCVMVEETGSEVAIKVCGDLT